MSILAIDMSKAKELESIARGHEARRAGRSDEALAHYLAALQQAPSSPDANSLYGLMLLQAGRAKEAEAFLRKALEISPHDASAQLNLAEWHLQRGELDQAIELTASATRTEPKQWWAWSRLGDALAAVQRFADAADAFGRAAELQPNDPSLQFKLARSNFDAGRRDVAERALVAAARAAPTNPAVLRLMAEMLEAKANWLELEKVARVWTGVAPNDLTAWHALARAQWESGRPKQAVWSFQNAMNLSEPNPDLWAMYGRLCLTALEYDNAEKALRRAEELDASNPHMLSTQAILKMFRGQYDDAISYCRRSLAREPNDVTALKTLTQLTRGEVSENEFGALTRLAEGTDRRPQDRSSALFAIGECRHAQGKFDEAFAAFAEANRLALSVSEREGMRYSVEERRKQIDELISMFPGPIDAGAQGRTPAPIFIVGMPRSGTTLVESVIGAHSSVLALGELPIVRWIMQEFLPSARASDARSALQAQWRPWSEWFYRELPDVGGSSAVTDKNPWNHDALGVILSVFPNARVIHVRRNAVDTGFSLFRNEFSKFVPFSNRLEDIASYYAEYARLMAHWEKAFAGRFATIQYEDLVRRLDVVGPELLAACGLEWEQACGEYWQSNRVISTLSTMQARRPPKAREQGGGPYAQRLEPLRRALEAAGVDVESGALASK